MSHRECSRLLNRYFFASYLLVLLLVAGFFHKADLADGRTALFAVCSGLSYGAIYLLPAYLISRLGLALLCRRGRAAGWRATRGIAIATTALTAIALYADSVIFGLFHFHLNGFVWNLLKTPGGIASLGLDNASILRFTAIGAGFFAGQSLILWLSVRLRGDRPCPRPRKFYRYLAVALLLLALGERIVYSISHLQAHGPVLMTAELLPLYQPTTVRSLAKRLGCEVRDEAGAQSGLDGLLLSGSGKLRYPRKPIETVKPRHPLNVVWLMVESLRADMLDPQIMPATWAFSERAHRFTGHYSGGNASRMGLFSAFYGLHGPYWFSFLEARRPPLIMDLLQEQGYQLALHVSSSFSYPELDRTVFAEVPAEAMHSVTGKPSWQRDAENVDGLVEFIQSRDRNRPFMAFMFFDAPHARYSFPEASALRRPFLEDLSYAALPAKGDIGLLKNRYINACHFVDSQLARLFALLEQEGLLDESIVLITGDHGQEFLEKGNWAHNSHFTEEQTRVPMVLWIPGTGAGETDRLTSHVDIVPTLLPRLGVTNPAEDYALGHDLLGPRRRQYAVLGDWRSLCYLGPQHKARIPLRSGGLAQMRLTRRDDGPAATPQAFLHSQRHVMRRLSEDFSRFRSR